MAQYAQKDYERENREFGRGTFDEIVAGNWWQVVRLIRGSQVEIKCRSCRVRSRVTEVGYKCPRCSRETE